MTGEQGELLPAVAPGAGNLEKAARRTVEAAQLDEVDAIGAQALVDLAAVIDRQKNAAKVYVVPGLYQQLIALLVELKLTPASRAGDSGDDEFSRLVAQLGQ